MNREGKKCVLYPRVSTEMQVDGYSLEGQKNGLKRFADREEMEIGGIYEDAGKSGKSIEGRPAFKKMLSDIKNGLEIDYILVYKLSRFGRNAADILNSLEFVQSYGKIVIFCENPHDDSTILQSGPWKRQHSMKKVPRNREEKEGVRSRRGRQRLPLIPAQRASLALWVPPAESVDGTAAFCYNYIAMNMEMYRSGRNENDSKSKWMLRRKTPYHERTSILMS